jgi:GAF domain-containing protein
MTLATTGGERPTQRTLDEFTRLAGRLLGVPVVHVSFVAHRGRMVASSYGRPVSIALLLCYPFSRHIAASRRPLVVADARRHPLTARTPAVRDGLVTAYAGVPLIDAAGRAVGALCVMDPEPRAWSDGDLVLLRDVARLLVSELAQQPPLVEPLRHGDARRAPRRERRSMPRTPDRRTYSRP